MRKLNMFMLLEKLESLATIQSKNPRRLFFSLCSLPHNTRNTTSSTAATFFVCAKNGFLGRPPNKKKKEGSREDTLFSEKNMTECATQSSMTKSSHTFCRHTYTRRIRVMWTNDRARQPACHLTPL